MPIVYDYQNVRETRQQANRAGAGQRLVTQQQMQLAADQNARANAALQMQAQQNQQSLELQYQQLFAQQQNREAQAAIEMLKLQDKRTQDDYENYLDAYKARQADDRFMESVRWHDINETRIKANNEARDAQRALNERNVKTQEESLSLRKQESEDRRNFRLAQDASKKDAEALRVSQNMRALDDMANVLPGYVYNNLKIAAAHSPTLQFTDRLNKFGQMAAAGTLDNDLLRTTSVNYARANLEAEKDALHSQLQSLDSELKNINSVFGAVEYDEADVTRISQYRKQLLFRYGEINSKLAALAPMRGISANEFMEITGTRDLSALTMSMATDRLSKKIIGEARTIAERAAMEEAVASGKNPNPVTSADIDKVIVERNMPNMKTAQARWRSLLQEEYNNVLLENGWKLK